MGDVDQAVLTRAFSPNAVKQRPVGGGRTVSYVDGATVIRRLNEATGNNWNLTVDKYWSDGHVNLALVTLTLPGLGSRQHIGVQSRDGSGEDASAKGAITDALKKAASLFGVGIELWGPDFDHDEGSRIVDSPVERAPQPQRQTPTPPQPQAPAQPSTNGPHQYITDRQAWKITSLAGERDMSVNQAVQTLFPEIEDPTTISKFQASEVIQHLMTLPPF